MGGPATSVFFSCNLTDHQRDDIRNLCARMGEVLVNQSQVISFNMQTPMPLGKDWPLPPDQPLSLTVSFVPVTEEYTADELRQLFHTTAFSIRSRLDVMAYTNSKTSHMALALLTRHLARTYHGLIDLRGTLDDWTQTLWDQIPEDAEDQEIIDLYADHFQGHKGKLWMVYYKGEGYRSLSHYCDADFLTWWLKQPQFSLAK